ncbi:MAG TPA: hypothetical protein V6C65_26300 [Allocoleopsis sp.]
MATRNQWNQEDEEESKKTGLESGVLGGTGAQTPGTQANNSGSWTNLQQYLDTNKGSGNAIADETLKGVNQEITNTKGTIDTWAKTAQERANANKVNDVWSDTIKNSSADDIAKIDKDKLLEWKKLAANWGGAANAQGDLGYDGAKGAADTTWGKIENANNWQGQQKLAQDTYGKNGRYSSGMGTLDAFVARGDAQGKFDDFKSGNANFNDNFNTAKAGVDTTITSAKDSNKANYKNVMDSISARLTGIQGEQDTRATTQNAADKAKFEQAIKDKITAFNPGKYAGQDFNPGEIKMEDYMTTGKLTGSDVATDAEIAALNALGGFDDDATTGGYARPQAPNVNSMDEAKLQQEIERRYRAWIDGFRGDVNRPTPTGFTPGQGTGSGTGGIKNR